MNPPTGENLEAKKSAILSSNLQFLLPKVGLTIDNINRWPKGNRNAALRELIHAGYRAGMDEDGSINVSRPWSSSVRNVWFVLQRLLWENEVPITIGDGLSERYLSRMPEYVLLPDQERAIRWIGLKDRVEKLPDGKFMLHSSKPTHSLDFAEHVNYSDNGARILSKDHDIECVEFPLLQHIAPNPTAWLHYLIHAIDEAGEKGWKKAGDLVSDINLRPYQHRVYRWFGNGKPGSMSTSDFDNKAKWLASNDLTTKSSFEHNHCKWKSQRHNSMLCKFAIDGIERLFGLELLVRNRATGYTQDRASWTLYLVEQKGDGNEECKVAEIGPLKPDWLPQNYRLDFETGSMQFGFLRGPQVVNPATYMVRETMRAFCALDQRRGITSSDSSAGKGIPKLIFENLGFFENQELEESLSPVYGHLSSVQKNMYLKAVLQRCWWKI